MNYRILILALNLILIGCGGNSDTSVSQNSANDDLRTKLAEVQADTDFTLLLENSQGKQFTYNTGNSNAETVYESASTSKLVTAVVILSLVEENILQLSDSPQTYIPSWPTSGNLSDIQLHHLLNFTSGLNNEPVCINSGLAITLFLNCVNRIDDENAGAPIPGETFYYSASHLQVAGAMAIYALGVSNWQEVFAHFKQSTGLFSEAVFDLPSIQNPRLAGGMHWKASEYMAFLKAIYQEDILNSSLLAELKKDQLNTASISYSPALNNLSQDWHYSYGSWIECNATSFNCTETTRLSSPGAYGAYPFIDYENKYFGILARQGALGTFPEGVALINQISDEINNWTAAP